MLLGIVSILFPKEGIRLSEGLILEFPKPQDIFSLDDQEAMADISEVLEQDFDFDALGIDDDDDLDELVDAFFDPEAADEQGLRQKVQPIEFPDAGRAVLARFFDRLDALAKGQSIRTHIAHYGDSQIEGDRISSFLRHRLQSKYGGRGPALLPAVQPYNYTHTFRQTYTGNWMRFPGFGRKDSTIEHSNYGALAAFSRLKADTTRSLSQGSLKFEAVPGAYSTARSLSEMRLFYKSKRTGALTITAADELLQEVELEAAKSLKVKKLAWNEGVSELSLLFQVATDLDILGISLESGPGIYVSNIAMRGGSGTVFTGFERSALEKMHQAMQTDLFILQYGGNVVPYVRDQSQINAYRRSLGRQIQRLRSMRPNASFLVIGPADASVKSGNRYVTMPWLEEVRDAVRQAALENDAAFWDMYTAMGGRNSMPSWVASSPTLASTDYVHFSARGAQVIANIFYNALSLEYERYKKQKPS